MSKNPFFSIIMPVYNVEKYLDEAISSVLNQTFRDFQLILVNDGSTDSSGLIANKYREMDSRITLITQANFGLSSARNIGLKYASGSYVQFVDSDDMIDRTTFQYVYELISENAYPEVVAFSAMPFLDGTFEISEGREELQNLIEPYEQNYLVDKLYSGLELYRERTRRQNFIPSAWLFVIKAVFLKEINLRFVEGILHEDEVFSRYLFINANNVYFTNKKLYQYRIRNDSIMQSKLSRHRVISLITVAEEIYALYKDRNIPELMDDARRRYNHAVHFYNNYFPTDLSIANRLISSSLFIHNLHKITPAGQSFKMYILSSCFHQYVDEIYQPLTARIVSNYILDDSIFIDLGAGDGFFSLIAADRSKAKKIISVESDPIAFEILTRNVSFNQFQNIVLYNLTNNESQAAIDYLASLLDNSGSDLFFKISAQGHEITILEGMKQIINRAFPKVRMIVEYSSKLIKQAGSKPGDLFALLFSLGFDVLILDDRLQVTYKVDPSYPGFLSKELSDFCEFDGSINLLCLPKNSPVSVLFFSHSSYLGGAEAALQTLISDIPRQGMVPTVVLPTDGPLKHSLEKNGAVTLVHPFAWWSDQNQIDQAEGQARLVKDFRAIEENLLPVLSRINPDVIVTNTSVIPWGGVSAFLINKPHLWYVHELGSPERGINFFYPHELIAEYIKGGANLVIVNSFFTKRLFFGESAQVRAEVIYPVSELERKKPAQSEIFFQQTDSLKIACLGQILPGKGQADAIYALNELILAGEKVEIVFAGINNFDYYQTLLDLIQEFNLASFIHFVGFLEFPYVLYAQSDVILIPYRNEPFGRVTLEAMSLGMPIVAAGSGGTLELIEDEMEGLLYPPGDFMQLSEKIKRFIYEPELRDKLGHRAAKKARASFSQDTTLTKFYEVLHKVAGEENQSSQSFFYWIMGLERKNRYIQLEEKDAQRDAQLAQRDAQLTAQLNAIYTSKIWRLGLWLRRIRLWVAPPGSIQARMGMGMLSMVRKIIRT